MAKRARVRTYESVRFDRGEGTRASNARRGSRNGPSPEWSSTRKNHLLVYPECRVCGEIDPSNHVHHLRYRGVRGVSEKPGDLVTLCRDHHNELHATMNGGSLVVHTVEFIRERSLDYLPVGPPSRAS